METVLHLGIDVAMEELVCCLMQAGCKDRKLVAGNNEVGIAEIMTFLGDHALETRVFIEATSRYHLAVSRALKAAGATVVVMNPARVRSLATGLGILDKDDALDARVLALASQMSKVEEVPLISATHQELRDLSRTIDSLTAANASNKKRLCSLVKGCSSWVVLKEVIKVNHAQIVKAKARWRKLLVKDAEIKRRYDLAFSVDGIGVESARGIAVETPANLDAVNNNQLCAYAGVVPRRDQSGTKTKKAKVGKAGNVHLRTCVFMACSRMVFITKVHSTFYLNLRSKGRTHLQAMTAVVHRVLRGVFAVLKRGTPWTAQRPS